MDEIGWGDTAFEMKVGRVFSFVQQRRRKTVGQDFRASVKVDGRIIFERRWASGPLGQPK